MLNFKNLSEKQALTYTILIAIGFLLIPTGLLFALQYESGRGIFSQIFNNPENLTVLLERSQKEKTIIEVELNKEKGLNETLKGLKEEYERYKKALPEADNLEDIYKLIGDVMAGSKIKVETMRPIIHEVKQRPKPVAAQPAVEGATAVPPPPPPPKTFPVNYVETIWTFKGDYQQILNCIHKVEDVDFERFVLISDLKLTPAVDPNNEMNLSYMSCEVTFVSFYYVKETVGEAK